MSDGSSDKQRELVKRGWGIPGALFLGLSAYFLPSVVLVFFAPGVQSLILSPNVANFVYAAAFEALVIGTIIIFVRAYGLRLKDIGLSNFKWGQLGLVAIGFGVYFLASIAISTVFSFFVDYDINQAQDVGFSNPSGIEVVMVFLVLVVLAPLAEELLFRGFIFQGLRRRLSFWATTIIVSILFAVVHGQINVALDVFALSLVLCWLREKTNSLWPAVILHSAKNGIAFVLLFILGLNA